MTKSELAKKLISNFPTHSNRELGKVLYKENKLKFKDAEDARWVIRSVRGASGKRERKRADPELKRIYDESKLKNPFSLPESDETSYEPYILPKSSKKILLLSDLHIPYHNIEAITLALEYGLDHEVDTVFINGDLLDCHKLSRFQKDPMKKDFHQELEATRSMLKKFREIFPKALMYFKYGNHDERYEHFLWEKAPELKGIEDFQLDILLRLRELNIHPIKDKQRVRAGNLNIMHGHEFGGGFIAPVNPARGYFLKAKDNIICGHNHQVSSHIEPTLNGKQISAHSSGCLCEMHPQYSVINKWSLGFACIDIHSDGDFYVRNFRIINGKII